MEDRDKIYAAGAHHLYRGKYTERKIEVLLKKRIAMCDSFAKQLNAIRSRDLTLKQKDGLNLVMRLYLLWWNQRVLPKIRAIEQERIMDVKRINPKLPWHVRDTDLYLKKSFERDSRECFGTELFELDLAMRNKFEQIRTQLKRYRMDLPEPSFTG